MIQYKGMAESFEVEREVYGGNKRRGLMFSAAASHIFSISQTLSAKSAGWKIYRGTLEKKSLTFGC